MIFDNIDFHNVEELEACEKGYIMWRLPGAVREQMNEGLRNRSSRYSTGIELRFKITGDSATVILQADSMEEAQVAYLYYGSFQGGWQNSSRVIGTQETRITIPRPDGLAVMKQITRDQELGFDPEVVRVVLPYGNCYYLGVEGSVEPPSPQDVPALTYLAYGSSITHGSLALAAPYTYPFRVAQKFKCDYLNLGFAGTAHMERAMAEYIVSRKDWDFASVEMGINMINFSETLLEERVSGFAEVLSRDARPVFATSLFVNNMPGDKSEKAARFREIVKQCSQGKLIFTDGLLLLGNPAFISQDMTHPSLEGIEEISDRWYRIMKEAMAGKIQ